VPSTVHAVLVTVGCAWLLATDLREAVASAGPPSDGGGSSGMPPVLRTTTLSHAVLGASFG
jgi:hypothetical protein